MPVGVSPLLFSAQPTKYPLDPHNLKKLAIKRVPKGISDNQRSPKGANMAIDLNNPGFDSPWILGRSYSIQKGINSTESFFSGEFPYPPPR